MFTGHFSTIEKNTLSIDAAKVIDVRLGLIEVKHIQTLFLSHILSTHKRCIHIFFLSSIDNIQVCIKYFAAFELFV